MISDTSFIKFNLHLLLALTAAKTKRRECKKILNTLKWKNCGRKIFRSGGNTIRSEGDVPCLLLSFAWKHDNGDLLLVVKGDVACTLIIQVKQIWKTGA
jgi:hypothetical protein